MCKIGLAQIKKKKKVKNWAKIEQKINWDKVNTLKFEHQMLVLTLY